MSRAEFDPGADKPAAVSQRLPIWLAGATLGPGLLAACVYAGLGAAQGEALTAIALTSVAACLAALLVGRSIVNTVEAATSTLRRFAGGEADARLDSAVGFVQFRGLARTINALAARVAERELQHALVSEATGDVIWKWSAATERVTWTGRVRSLFGVGSDHFEADSVWWHGRVHPKERDAVEMRLAAAMSGRDTHWSDEYRFRHEDGSYRWFWDRGVIIRTEDGAPLLFVGCMTDISEKRAAEQRIWQLANNDELTGLPNRKVFQAELDSLVEAARGSTTLLLIDIDQFKDVNDSLGHAAGDALLRSVGSRLKESVGESGTVFRLGGDEFAILLPGYAAQRAHDLAERLLSDLHMPMAVLDRLINARATIGIAAYPHHGATAAELLQNADLALYEGKGRGRDQIVCFDPGMRARLDQRMTLLRQVRQGIAERRFAPHYQPIVSLNDGSLCGVEALMRWRHSDGRLVTPGTFLTAYDDPELAQLLGDRLVEEVLADFRALDADGLAPPYIAINLSSASSRRSDFAERLIATIVEGGMPPARLAIELTETLLFGSHAGAIEGTVRELHHAGCRIALDDFGTGYASLTHLRKLPVDVIKIDQSFVQGIGADSDAQAIVSALLELGRQLGKDVIAEGVETAEHATMLRAAGCPQAQGFYFARPMPASVLRDYIFAERNKHLSRVKLA